MKNFPRHALLVAATFSLASCSSPVYYVTPREWSPAAKRDSLIQHYRPALQGRTIFLDPGHGGEDRTNRGPAGDAIEADVNLRVGLALRDYLTAAGARVILSRDHDTSIALSDRWPMAVRAGAEIFVSLHHNATGSADDVTNYASVYYHSRPGRADYQPANQDLARHIQRDMSYAMRNASPPYSPTFDGTLSDFDIYPNSGFAVLRGNPLPAALIEGSFFTHPHEERRLALSEFNRIEAWGIFLGIGKYFRTGFPVLSMRSDTIVTSSVFTMHIGAEPWQEIDRRSLELSFAGSEPAPTFVDSLRMIEIPVHDTLRSGTYELRGSVRSRAGKASWPFIRHLTVMLPAAGIAAGEQPPTLPPITGAALRVTFRVTDINGDPAADGMPVRLRSPLAGIDTTIGTAGGRGLFYLTPPQGMAELPIEIETGTQRTALQVRFLRHPFSYASGTVRSELTGAPIPGATVSLSSGGPPANDTADGSGRFIVADTGSVSGSIRTARAGYFPAEFSLPVFAGTPLEILLAPVAGEKLQGRTFVIDARYGGTEGGGTDSGGMRPADVNLLVARRLWTLLCQAGASAHLVRETDTTIAESERARRSAGYPRGMYIRIDAGNPGRTAGAEIYRNISNRRLAEHLLRSLASFAHLDTTSVVNGTDRFFNDVAMGTISLRLPSPVTGMYDSEAARVVDRLAWALFGGILRHAGHGDLSPTRQVPPGTEEVSLGHLFTQIPDANGRVDFFGLEQPAILPVPEGTVVPQPQSSEERQ